MTGMLEGGTACSPGETLLPVLFRNEERLGCRGIVGSEAKRVGWRAWVARGLGFDTGLRGMDSGIGACCPWLEPSVDVEGLVRLRRPKLRVECGRLILDALRDSSSLAITTGSRCPKPFFRSVIYSEAYFSLSTFSRTGSPNSAWSPNTNGSVLAMSSITLSNRGDSSRP